MTAVAEVAHDRSAFTPITREDREAFHEAGYLQVPRALTGEQLAEVTEAVDRTYAEAVRAGGIAQGASLHRLGITSADPAFTRLLDLGPTFRIVWGLLGWNIYSQHGHLDVNPPRDETGDAPTWGWHQDGWRQNSDAEFDPALYGHELPRPLFSVKVAFVLSDLSEPGRGQTLVLPGSQHRNRLARPADPSRGFDHPAGARPLLTRPGDAVVFDRRLWHSRSPNHSATTRKVVFVSYTWRWIRPVDDVAIDTGSRWWRSLNPVQRQLLGEASHAVQGYWGVREGGAIDDRIPLRHELKRRGLLDPSVPWLR